MKAIPIIESLLKVIINVYALANLSFILMYWISLPIIDLFSFSFLFGANTTHNELNGMKIIPIAIEKMLMERESLSPYVVYSPN